jgi:hypothetical protein
VALADGRTGQAIANATDVRVVFSMREMEMGSPFLVLNPSDPTKGRYISQGSVLSMRGNWDVSVVVKRKDRDDVSVPFNFKVR